MHKQLLDPLIFPLYGSRLIEASAGTGKTYTIAALYIRLIIGHGGTQYAYAHPLNPAEILVVTFTDAATKELRDRIRILLSQAANYFNHDQINVAIDHQFLIALRNEYPIEEWAKCAYHLKNAAESMDDAAIMTIHSWCNTMLRAHAFHSGDLVKQNNLITDQKSLIKKISYDYWRKFISPLNYDAVMVLKQLKKFSIEDLSEQVFKLINYVDILDHADAPELILNCSNLLASHDQLHAELMQHATHWIFNQLALEQARLSSMGYNDLLIKLDLALRASNHAALIKIIKNQFPVIMVDEFQDTDPIQYRIFDTIYQIANNHRDTAIILIGDPKQAIYSFRGADIYSYLNAHHKCQERLYTLKTNFRSTHEMVAAANHCFEHAESHNTSGAFIFRKQNQNPVPFIQADANGLTDNFYINDKQHSALNIWLLAGNKLSKKDYRQRTAAYCATEINNLLTLGQQHQAGFVVNAKLKPLRPADLAILVNDHIEANIVRTELTKCGIASVYLSDKNSVFQSFEVRDLFYWLEACADPDNAYLLRTALASILFNLSWQQLDDLISNDQLYVLKFRNYRNCWQRQGVLPMIRKILDDFQIAQRLLQTNEGKRTLTNILHLAELLQQHSIINSEHALIRYLIEQCAKAKNGITSDNDLDQMRLETDDHLIKVVTVHKAKGLAYKLVFVPFTCDHKKLKFPLKYHDEQGQTRIAFSNADLINDTKDAVEREYLSEELRKFYVALTRACYTIWIGVGHTKEFKQAAFNYLINGGQEITYEQLVQKLTEWRQDNQNINIKLINHNALADNKLFLNKKINLINGKARKSQRKLIEQNWWIASYSALKKNWGINNEPETFDEDIIHETLILQNNDDAINLNTNSLHNFPRGAEAGKFLHDLLKSAAYQGFARFIENQKLLFNLVNRRCQLYGWSPWTETLTSWLNNFLTKPLIIPAYETSFANSFSFIKLENYLAEMEFLIAVHNVINIEKLDQLICKFTLNQELRPPLPFGTLRGMFKGFIDLVFKHKEHYYIVDYKSNWLGLDDHYYTPQTMRAAIIKERYELQYVIYLFALHRLLKSRLADYQYERDIGGAIYIFLRGCDAPGQGMHIERPPYELMKQLDDLFNA